MPEYRCWRNRRINDNIPAADPENGVSMEEHLKVDPSEMEMEKHDFKKKCARMERQISRLENEKNQLKFNMQSQEHDISVYRVREVAEHLQTLAIEADVLSLQIELESNKGKKLAWLFRKIKNLGVKAMQYV
ncbi:hypothetical protein HRI_004108700 [Hibiscus trionum]|uniref:Uncharacterized protein n=1 Tax=Hibiscus trionum TaxID=183268 RepID=A0A9W7IYR9_HIBTR|nr:hypothetical protein HRI_004108700 [Hibiscus trionum]